MACFVVLLAQSSTNYKLQSYGFGSGGVGDSTSANYGLNAMSGEVSENQLSSTNFKANPGLEFTQMANVPNAPTFVNTTGYWYDQLHFVVLPSANPTDTIFAIAISSDNFVTTNFIQNDNTVGPVLGSEDYQTYSAWGGSGGQNVIGLVPSTTYKIKVKAMQGKYSETGFGPVSSASTAGASMIFDIDVSATNSETSPPYAVDFGGLTPNTVNNSPVYVWVDFETNATSGGKVYIYGQNGGLLSPTTSYNVTSVTGDLGALTEGYGAIGSTHSEGSGGPLAFASPYNGAADNVGILDTSIRDIFTTTGPIFTGRGSFLLKTRITSITPAAPDYADTLTVIAAAAF